MGLLQSISAYKANIAFTKRNYDKALKLYDKITSKANVNPAILIKYAYVAIYLGKLDLCKEVLDKVNYDGLDNDILLNSYKQTEGLYVWKNGNIEEAIEIYKDLHNRYRNTSIYETLGYLLIVNENYTEALKYNLEAYDYNSDNNVIADNLAETYYYLKQPGKAKEIYVKIHEAEPTKQPKFAEAYYYYGLILKLEGKIDKAKEMLERALTMRESYLSILSKKDIEEELNLL